MSTSISNTIPDALLKKLCWCMCSNKEHFNDVCCNALRTFHEFVGSTLYTTTYSSCEEFVIVDDIKCRLSHLHLKPEEKIDKFQALYRRLCSKDFVKNKASILLFLLKVSEGVDSHEVNNSTTSFFTNSHRDKSLSLQESVNRKHSPSGFSFLNSTSDSPKSDTSGIRVTDSAVKNPAPNIHLYSESPLSELLPLASSSHKGSTKRKTEAIRKNVTFFDTDSSSPNRPTSLTLAGSSRPYTIEGDYSVSEFEIIRELLYCLKGIDGKFIKYDPTQDRYVLSRGARVKQTHVVMRVIELASLYANIEKYLELHKYNNVGVIYGGFISALEKELRYFKKDVAGLACYVDQYVKQTQDTPLSEEVGKNTRMPTLRQIAVWAHPHITSLKFLQTVILAVQHERGGQFISKLSYFSFIRNPKHQRIMRNIVISALKPWFNILCKWMVQGQLLDVYKEFFVEFVPNASDTELWQQLFIIRNENIPVFLNQDQVKEIMQAGRCMHFLIKEAPPYTESQLELRNCADNEDDLMLLLNPESKLFKLISTVSVDSSKLVLRSLQENFHLYNQLEALRKFMLLGQGDFIHCFMELAKDYLNNSADSLHYYTLNGFLEIAVRSSNARYNEEDILNRLHFKLLEASASDAGWDAFCLSYNTSGPLNMIFKLGDGQYNTMFTFLWRIKRAEFFLSRVWGQLKLLHKEMTKYIPEFQELFLFQNGLFSQMIHFITHFQYYTSFEVVEVSWNMFRKELVKMESLDKVIDAHSNFMKSIRNGCLLTNMTISKRIRTLLDCIFESVKYVETFKRSCKNELKRRKCYEEKVEQSGTNYQEEKINSRALLQFKAEMKKDRSRFVLFTKRYEMMQWFQNRCLGMIGHFQKYTKIIRMHEEFHIPYIQKFIFYNDAMFELLVLLFGSNERTLLSLGCRLDFNNYYNREDALMSKSIELKNKEQFTRQKEYSSLLRDL